MKGLPLTALILGILSVLLGLWALLVVYGGTVGTFLGARPQPAVPVGVTTPTTIPQFDKATTAQPTTTTTGAAPALEARTNATASALSKISDVGAYRRTLIFNLRNSAPGLQMQAVFVPIFRTEGTTMVLEGWAISEAQLLQADQAANNELAALEEKIRLVANDTDLASYLSQVTAWATKSFDSPQASETLRKANLDLIAMADVIGESVEASENTSLLFFVAAEDSDLASSVMSDALNDLVNSSR